MPLPDLSLGWLSLPQASPLELISAAAGAGFSSVSLRIAADPGDPEPALASDPQMVRQVKAALSDTGIFLAEMGSIRMHGPRPSDWCLPSLEAGASLGAHTLIALIFEPNAHKRLEDFCDLCQAASVFGLRVAIEFALFSAVPTLEDAQALALASGMANAGIAVDALHLARSGGQPANLHRVAPELIFLAQLCDAPAVGPTDLAGLRQEARQHRLDPGCGDLPLVDFVLALPAYFPLELEVPCSLTAALSPAQRAKQIAERSRDFLSARGIYSD